MIAGRSERGVSRLHIVSALVGAAIVVWLVLRPLWAMHGIPAFNHDWSWPPDRIQAWSQFRDAISPFTRNNFGQFNFYIGSAPSSLAAALAVQMFGAQLGVVVNLAIEQNQEPAVGRYLWLNGLFAIDDPKASRAHCCAAPG